MIVQYVVFIPYQSISNKRDTGIGFANFVCTVQYDSTVVQQQGCAIVGNLGVKRTHPNSGGGSTEVYTSPGVILVAESKAGGSKIMCDRRLLYRKKCNN